MILVTGLDYSGTSATAGLLYHLGVDMGQVRLTLPDVTDFTQAYIQQCGGQPRDYLTFEDEWFNASMHSMFFWPDCLRAEMATLFTWKALTAYAHTKAKHAPPYGLKNNWGCLLGNLKDVPGDTPWITTLVMTTRDETARQASRKKYLGAEGYARTQEWDQWLQAGFAELSPQAHVLVPFEELLRTPETIIAHLCFWCKLFPTDHQWQTAYDFIMRRD